MLQQCFFASPEAKLQVEAAAADLHHQYQQRLGQWQDDISAHTLVKHAK